MKAQANFRYDLTRVRVEVKKTKNTVQLSVRGGDGEISIIVDPSDALRLRDAIDRAFREEVEIDAR